MAEGKHERETYRCGKSVQSNTSLNVVEKKGHLKQSPEECIHSFIASRGEREKEPLLISPLTRHYDYYCIIEIQPPEFFRLPNLVQMGNQHHHGAREFSHIDPLKTRFSQELFVFCLSSIIADSIATFHCHGDTRG